MLNPSPPHDPTPFLQDDKIMFEEVPLSSLIQYRFSADSPWLLAPISVESLVFYRSSKFEIWKDMLMKGGNGCLVSSVTFSVRLRMLLTQPRQWALALFYSAPSSQCSALG